MTINARSNDVPMAKTVQAYRMALTSALAAAAVETVETVWSSVTTAFSLHLGGRRTKSARLEYVPVVVDRRP